jgi:hypothetical protein
VWIVYIGASYGHEFIILNNNIIDNTESSTKYTKINKQWYEYGKNIARWKSRRVPKLRMNRGVIKMTENYSAERYSSTRGCSGNSN